MTPQQGPTPPALARCFLRVACPGTAFPEVEGDFREVFANSGERRGWPYARRRYWREVVLFCFWRITRRWGPARSRSGTPTPSASGPRGRRPRGKSGGAVFPDLVHDLRYGVRALARSPGFTAIAVFILALGIGANATMFTLANSIFLQPPPHVLAPEELVGITRITDQAVASWFGYPDYRFYRDNNEVFTGVLAYTSDALAVAAGSDDVVTQANAWIVSGNFFDVLGVQPAHGRWFLPEEDETPDAYPVAVVSHGYWLREMGGDPQSVGHNIQLNGRSFTVVGVTPKGFRGISPVEAPPDIYLPITMRGAVIPGPQGWFTLTDGQVDTWLRLVARLRAGVEIETARANLTALRERWKREFAPWIDATEPQPFRVGLTSRFELTPGAARQLDTLLHLFFAVVGTVLLIACANIAILLLARGSRRTREIGIRAALGAGRGRVIRQLLTEGSVLSMLGGAGGLLIAHWGAKLAATLFPVTFAVDFGTDMKVLAGTIALSVGVAMLFGLAPAWHLSHTDISTALLRGAQRGGRTPFRNALVVSQIALSMVLVIGAGLFVRSLKNAESTDLGFVPDGKLLMSVQLANHGYDRERGLQFIRAMMDRIQGVPGVGAVTTATMIPFRGSWGSRIRVPGTQYAEEGFNAGLNRVGPGYFDVMGIPILAGRGYTNDDRASAARVAIVNERLAEQLWPNESPVGKIVVRGDHELTVIGMARTATYYEVGEEPTTQVYLPLLQSYDSRVTFMARTGADPAAFARPVEGVLREYDPTIAIYGVTTMKNVVDGEFAQYRVLAILVTLFGGLALLLAAVGLYGVQSYLVAGQTKEIGVRMALGALHNQIAGSVLGRGLVLTGFGVALGVAGALGLAHLVEGLLFGVSARDPATYVIVPVTLMVVAAVASLVPALRASRVDPVVALRDDG